MHALSTHTHRLSAQDAPVWIQVGQLLDGTGAPPIEQAHLVYNKEAILYVGKASAPPSADHLQREPTSPDHVLNDHTVLPGLVEAHAHLFLEGDEIDRDRRSEHLQKSNHDLLSEARTRLHTLPAIGVMAIRDAGDNRGVGLALSADTDPSLPYIDSPGAALHHQGRYGSFMSTPIEDSPDIGSAVRQRCEDGAQRIKLIASGIIDFKTGSPSVPTQTNTEEVQEIVTHANSEGRSVFAHASGAAGITHVIEGGVDTVEHGFFITDTQLAQMRDRSIAWVPTCYAVQVHHTRATDIGWPKETADSIERIMDQHRASIQRALDLGVTVLAGCDCGSCGVPHGLGLFYELEELCSAGMSNAQAIHTATGLNARRLNMPDTVGHLQPGAQANMILTAHNPLDDIRNLQKERLCVFKGQLLPPALTKGL